MEIDDPLVELLKRDTQAQARILLRFAAQKVPGERLQRGFKVTTDFCDKLGRAFDEEIDYAHTSPDCISESSKKAYILIDVNVKTPGSDVKDIPLFCYNVTYDGSGVLQYSPWQNVKVPSYCGVYRWGGNETSSTDRGNLDHFIRGPGLTVSNQ